MFVVGFSTMALIIVLSVFNGLEDLLRDLYGSFDPEIKIESVKGKSFELNTDFIQKINDIPGVNQVVFVVEDQAYVKYNKSEMVAVIKGVSANYPSVNRLKSKIVEGELNFWNGNIPMAVVGQGIQYSLGVSTADEYSTLQVYYPKNLRSKSLNMSNTMTKMNLQVAGVFAIERQFDEKYIIVPITFASELFRYQNRVTALEVSVAEGSETLKVQAKLKAFLGNNFKVQNADEQHDIILRTVKIEKLFVFVTFIFIIGVSSINIFFALSMLAIDKKKDIGMLFSMGATARQVRSIFLAEGAIISLSGAVVGLLLGLIIIILQQEVGLVRMGLQTSVIDYYPVKLQVQDFVFTAGSIILITFLVSIRPAIMASKFSKVIRS
ncbi:Lipoprotein releasing system transmembrane protein LolC/LolE [hydrothermal vent metagenome]|uniref:Lipoprotein releasing system transmembrane protein LolC/LolE n=1 Tax=hydrothermal vent metagenome TaxID=652676 RepID=A0A3B0UDF0_9ZZZZ